MRVLVRACACAGVHGVRPAPPNTHTRAPSLQLTCPPRPANVYTHKHTHLRLWRHPARLLQRQPARPHHAPLEHQRLCWALRVRVGGAAGCCFARSFGEKRGATCRQASLLPHAHTHLVGAKDCTKGLAAQAHRQRGLGGRVLDLGASWGERGGGKQHGGEGGVVVWQRGGSERAGQTPLCLPPTAHLTLSTHCLPWRTASFSNAYSRLTGFIVNCCTRCSPSSARTSAFTPARACCEGGGGGGGGG